MGLDQTKPIARPLSSHTIPLFLPKFFHIYPLRLLKITKRLRFKSIMTALAEDIGTIEGK